MKTTSFLFLFILINNLCSAQWAGEYTGFLSGDPLKLTLIQSGQKLSGQLSDSRQSFDLTGDIQGNRMAGEARERSLGLKFGLLMEKQGNTLKCKLLVEFAGESSEIAFTLNRLNTDPQTESKAGNALPKTKIPFPAGAVFPSELAGKWTKNESYNSGYGDNFMGANFSQSMSLHEDGSISEGGNSANISGSNYYGQSSNTEVNKIEGLGWYAIDKQLYLIVLHEGSWQSVHLGRWYVEENNLLITASSGEKLLLSR